MDELGLRPNAATKKSARIVGDTMGKYHPHGDFALYDALVRMAQDFSLRYPLVQGQGNFGSVDGDPAAAMRYTEAKLSRLGDEMLADLGKETVDFVPNFDESLSEPAVLPAAVPNLLINGSSGIAVGMATNMAPHKCDALLHLLDTPECSIRDLMRFVQGPDFPTRGFIYAGQGLTDAYHTGRGTVKVRGRVEVEERKKGAQAVVIREIPYGLNKSGLVEKIAALVNDRKLDGVADLRDESDRTGIRVVLDLKRGAIPDIITNALYKYTPLETSFGINMLAVADNRPQVLNLKSALSYFLDHRREVVARRTRFDLARAEARAHILEGLRIALDHIDEVVRLIRGSKTPPEAKEHLMRRFGFSELQAQAILDMRLQRLTNLEHEKLLEEYRDLLKSIEYFKSILASPEVLREVLRQEIQELKETYAGKRRSEVLLDALDGIAIEDLIPDEDVVITLSRRGYIKRTTLDNYQQQRRGGKGIAGVHTGDGDFVQDFLSTTNHRHLLLFTNKGPMHHLKVHQVPEGSRTANLKEDDELIMVRPIEADAHVALATAGGYAIRFACGDVRPVGRGAAGVKGIALRRDDSVVAGLILRPDDQSTAIMSISALGYGKRTLVSLYRLQSRGGKGILNFRVTSKTGPVVGGMPVREDDALILLTSTNKIIRMGLEEVRSIGRATSGVRLVNLDEGARVVGFDRLALDESSRLVEDGPSDNV